LRIVDRWLNAAFSGGRHWRRVEKIAQMERAEALTPTLRTEN